MQNESNTKYTGLEELLTTEKNRKNYNRFIVESCLKKVEKPNNIIDFGAGIGTLSEILKQKFNTSPICIEIDEKNIKYLNNRNFENFKNIDDVKGKVDLVFSSNVLEHVKDDFVVLKSINNKLNSNCYLYLYLPANMLLWSEVDESVGHYRRYSRLEIKKKLISAGFEIKSIYYADSIGFMAILIMKLIGYDADKVIESSAILNTYDRYIFPLSKFFDAIGLKFLFGKNLIVLAKKIN